MTSRTKHILSTRSRGLESSTRSTGDRVEHSTARPQLHARSSTKTNRVSRFFAEAFGRGHGNFPLTPLDEEIKELEEQVQSMEKINMLLAAEHGQWNSNIDTLKAEIESVEHERVTNREDLERITNELTVAQRFLSTADTVAQADVIRSVESINDEIFQLAAVVADTIKLETKYQHRSDSRREWEAKVSPPLGPAFLDLVVPKKLDDVLAIQLGWQAILVYTCASVLGTWATNTYRKSDQFLAELYTKIYATSDQAIAGRWRSILHSAMSNVAKPTSSDFVGRAAEKAVALPLLCGYIRDQKEYDALYEQFKQRLRPLIDKTLELRKVLREGITSMDIRPYYFNPGHQYVAEYMELEYEEEEPKVPDENTIIACSLTLGVYRTIKTRGADGILNERDECILKPKCILQSTLAEVI